MKNLEKLMKKEQKKYSKKEIQKILSKSVDHSGIVHILVMSMEEISELIEVIAMNTRKTDYLHHGN